MPPIINTSRRFRPTASTRTTPVFRAGNLIEDSELAYAQLPGCDRVGPERFPVARLLERFVDELSVDGTDDGRPRRALISRSCSTIALSPARGSRACSPNSPGAREYGTLVAVPTPTVAAIIVPDHERPQRVAEPIQARPAGGTPERVVTGIVFRELSPGGMV